MEDTIYHGWFSPANADIYGYAIYLDKNGNQVCISAVYEDKEKGEKAFNWADKVYVGELTKFVSSHWKEKHSPKSYIDLPMSLRFKY